MKRKSAIKTDLVAAEHHRQSIDKLGDPLATIEQQIDFAKPAVGADEIAPRIENPKGERPAYLTETMVRILVLKRLYNLSDEQVEYKPLNRMSYKPFCGLTDATMIPDRTTVWTFENRIGEAGAWAIFDGVASQLFPKGYIRRCGQVIDATLVPASVQYNSRGEREILDQGALPAAWKPAKRRQKDMDASWTKKHGKSHYGDTLSVNAVAKHRVIRKIKTSTAAEHQNRHFEEVIDSFNTSRIQAFSDTIDHELLMKAVRHHTDDRWVLLYIERWLKADLIRGDGTRAPRTRGTPQGGVISPLLANLFLHYVFDCWMGRTWPDVPFARYADDAVCHCRSLAQAQQLVDSLRERFAACGLTIHPEKTRIVYCREGQHQSGYPVKSFDFLGHTFRARSARTRDGRLFVGFNPAASPKALKAMSATIRGWQLHKRVRHTLESLAQEINPVLPGWVAYYGRFNRAALNDLFRRLEIRLNRWARQKYKHMRCNRTRSWESMRTMRARSPSLFEHWRVLYTGRNGSRTRAV